MNFIGDFFALGLVLVLSVFFFDGTFALTKTSKFFLTSLLMTALTAVSNLLTGYLMGRPDTPLWLNMAVNSLYFCVNIFATTSIALYVLARILEHSHEKHCLRNAYVGLGICFAFYLTVIILNLWTGWLFYFNEQNQYCRGPLNSIGYMVAVCQVILVLICYLRNRKNANLSIKRVLIDIIPIFVMCTCLQRMYPEIMLNSFSMSMVDTVLFLIYQGQREGVHVLTKLNDRHRFFDSVDEKIKNGSVFQAFLINLKDFGMINQKYGHVFGDEALYQFAFALERLIKNSKAFHMNGTVFALLIPYLDQQTADRHLQTLLNFLESGILCANNEIHFEYVLVEYITSAEETDTESFYEKLEYAAAKAYRNRSRFIHYTPSLGEEMQRRRYMIERLQSIDVQHGFEVWYQPIKCMKTNRFCSMEALIRLREPDGRLVSPGEFIPLAEETGMIGLITWFVLEQVCQTLQNNPVLQYTSVAVNLPMAQLMENSFVVRLNSIVDRYGLDHRRIILEFTERAILENFEQVKYVMREIRKEGYRFYLDDFGAGYSNFNCLLQLPFEVVKLDATMIQLDLGETGQRNLGLIKMLISFLHQNNILVVAEGVETQALSQRLQEQQIDRIQGYLFAAPMPEKDLIAFYEKSV